MNTQHLPCFEPLRVRLDAAVGLRDSATIARQVKNDLQETLRCQGLALPEHFYATRPDTYARRLLHRDPQGRYTAVVMTWGPGQGTPLHDHAGIWCVECVVDGAMEVRQYDLVDQRDERYRFEPQRAMEAARGSAGCLIPPYEYHTLSNASEEQTSVTLHIYGGEMTHCHVFEPQPDGTYVRRQRELSYHGD